MGLLDRIRKHDAKEEPAAPASLDQVGEELATAPRRPFPTGTNEPAWIRHQRELREAAGGRFVATKEL